MSTVEYADLMAARRMLNADGKTHDNVFGLPGAERCPHALTGSGDHVDDFEAVSIGGFWRKRPYRHHTFTPATATSITSSATCRCHNTIENPIHQGCGLAARRGLDVCDDCHWTNGQHNPYIDH